MNCTWLIYIKYLTPQPHTLQDISYALYQLRDNTVHENSTTNTYHHKSRALDDGEVEGKRHVSDPQSTCQIHKVEI